MMNVSNLGTRLKHRATMRAGVAVAAALLISLAACQQPNGPPPPHTAQISFVNHGGIDDWKAEGQTGILIRSRAGDYYRATFTSPCYDLPFAQTAVGFVTDALDTLDKFDSIVVRGHQCYFATFDQIPKPPNWH